MKKFWNLMLAALVIIGATACTENYEGVDKVQEAGFSFYAEVVNDGTRAYIDNEDGDKTWNTVWEQGDKLIVEVAEAEQGGGGAFEVEFECMNAEKGQFVSYEDDAANLQGQNVTITTVDDHKYHSLQGKKAFYTNTVVNGFDNTKPIQLEAHTSFFRYTYNGEGEVKLTLSEAAFRAEDGTATKEVTISGYGEHFVAFWPNVETTSSLALAINGEGVKSADAVKLTTGKIYNLGTYEGTKNESFGIVGAHQGWKTDNLDAMYLIPGSNTYVRRNVKLSTGGFKIYGTTTKTVTIEHPEVTGGETGYLFLKPNSNWTQANARFAAYFFGNGEEWMSMTDANKDGIYAVQKPKKTYPNVIFCRMNPSATTNGWGNKWNQTGDLTIPSDGKNLFTVPSGSWDGSTTAWSVHTVVEHQDAWTEVTEEITTYWFGKNGSDNISNWVTGYSNNPGNSDITVSDYSKLYDIYFSREADQDWGFVYYFTVRESGSAQPALK